MKLLRFLKPISKPLLFVLIGIAIALAFFYFKYKKTGLFQNGESSYWTEIRDDEAKKLLSNYLEEQRNIWPHYFRLRTGDNEEILRGFWIDKKMIDEINRIVATMPNNPQINGYNIFLGKWGENAKRYYSLVVRATQYPDTTGVGKYFDMVDPCPDDCGSDD